MDVDDPGGFDALFKQATADPEVIGLILTGSHARGLATRCSDYDVRIIGSDESGAGPHQRSVAPEFPNVDLSVMPFGEFVVHADWVTPFTWNRYSFAHAPTLLDRTGANRPLVEEKRRLPADQPFAVAPTALDALINGVYRSLKCRRRGNNFCARWEASEAARDGLDFLFALDGRIRPCSVWLVHGLHLLPLRLFPLSGDAMIVLVTLIVDDGDAGGLQRLLQISLEQARSNGHQDLINTWGSDIDGTLCFSPDAT